MIVLGLILLILGLVFAYNLLTALGLILILVGLVLNFGPPSVRTGPGGGRWW